MGPLCCPSVLARFPVEKHNNDIWSISTLSGRKGDAVYKCEPATTLAAAVKGTSKKVAALYKDLSHVTQT